MIAFLLLFFIAIVGAATGYVLGRPNTPAAENARAIRAEALNAELNATIIELNATVISLGEDLLAMAQLSQQAIEEASQLKAENAALRLKRGDESSDA